MRNRILVVTAAMILGTTSLPSQARVDIDIRVVPPLPRFEMIHAPRIGYVWVPGFWYREGWHRVWNAGHWAPERPRQHWAQERRSRGHDRAGPGGSDLSRPSGRDSERGDRRGDSSPGNRQPGRG